MPRQSAARTRPPSVSGAQTLLSALDILECFTTDGGSLTLAEISRSVGLTTPTTHRLLRALTCAAWSSTTATATTASARR